MIAAYLYSQLQNMDDINKKRIDVWNDYDEFFKQYEGIIKRPFIPDNCTHNAHMYYLLFENLDVRTKFIEFMKAKGISTVFHYIPLHSSPAGERFGRFLGNMSVTDKISDTLVRLPMFYELDNDEMNLIKENISEFMEQI